jgi:hypothetical protein
MPVRGIWVCAVKASTLGACQLLIASEIAHAIPTVELALGYGARQVADTVA